MAPHGDEGPMDPASPIANLALSDPLCANDSCEAFAVAHDLSQDTVSFYYQFEYGHWSTYYYVIIIFLFMLLHAFHIYRGYRLRASGGSDGEANGKGVGFPARALAGLRAFTYRRVPGRLAESFGLPSAGVLLTLLATTVMFITMTFAVQPYYRERRGYGSPPIAIRTGLMATACMPILVALAGKANAITFLPGIGHEKLNVIHRYVGWLCFLLAFTHTIPFLVCQLNEGGYEALSEQFYSPGAYEVYIFMVSVKERAILKFLYPLT